MKYECNKCDPGNPCELDTPRVPHYCHVGRFLLSDWQPVRTTRLMTPEECEAWACTEGAQGWQCRNAHGVWMHPTIVKYDMTPEPLRRTVQWNDGHPIYGEPQPMEVTV